MKEHSRYFSPSSLGRRIACYGSAFLEVQVLDDQPKSAANWGSLAHDIAAECLILKRSPEQFLGKEKYGQVCNEDMAECVVQYLKDVEELKTLVSHGIVSIEKTLNLCWLGHKDIFGTSDLIVDSAFDALVVGDLKTGKGVIVEPENNAQLYAYGLMAAGERIKNYQSIILAISQPRGKSGSKALSTYRITLAELMDWYIDVLRPTITAISNGDNTLTAGEEQCRFCRACNICHEYTKHATELAKVDFANPKPQPPIINDDLVIKVYPHLPMLKDWIKRVEGHAFSMGKAGSLIGYKLVAGRRSRKWIDEQKTIDTIHGLGIDPYEHKLLSPAKAEKALGSNNTALKELITVSDKKPVIVPEGDKRKAISTVEMDFSNINER